MTPALRKIAAHTSPRRWFLAAMAVTLVFGPGASAAELACPTGYGRIASTSISKPAEALRRQLFAKERDHGSFWVSSPLEFKLRDQLKKAGSRENLLPVLDDILSWVRNHGTSADADRGLATELFRMLDAFSKSPAFRRDLPQMVDAAAGARDLPGVYEFMSHSYGRAGDRATKEKIVDFFVGELAEEDRNSLLHFAKAHPNIARLKRIPIALGVHSQLEHFKTITRSVDYTEWSRLGWMADSTAIRPFKKALLKAANLAPRINFEVGKIIGDQELRNTFRRIDKEGDQNILNGIAELYTKFGDENGPEERPKLGKGKPSITTLELYWILKNPDFLAKTTFYRNGKPLPAKEGADFVRRLRWN